MNHRPSFPIPRFLAYGVFLILMWAGLTFAVHALTQSNTLGTDFYIFFHSGQAAFLHSSSPYSLELAQENQLAIFKRPAGPGEDQLGFAYPFYALFLLAPLLGLPFEWAQAAWTSLLLLGLVAALLSSVRQARPAVVASIIFLYPVSFGLILGNYAVLLGALLLVLFGLLRHPSHRLGEQVLAGILLAWLTTKPQLTWLYILFFVLVAVRRGQGGLLASFGASLAGLLACSFAFRPTWAAEWITSLQAYAEYNQTWPTLTILLRDILPMDLAAGLTWLLGAALLAGTGWVFYRWWKGQTENLPVFAWCGLIIYLLHPHGKSYEHIAYLIPLAVWAAGLPSLRRVSAWVFWFGSLGLSWLVFFISIQPGAPAGSTEWPVLFQAVWVGWLFLPEPAPYNPADADLNLEL